ncbi:hypothetical protein L208DRAFT_1423829 [Tricholoma matsutake]|nr:hypothetical protein L208DRAFT_1423829 [Tricholoma matsutake 945]
MAIETLDDEVGEEAVKIYLEEEDSLTDHINMLLTESLEDFPEDDTSDSVAQHAAEITCANITDEKGFEGRKYSMAILTQAVLTFWYQSVRRHKSVTEWHYDPKTGVSYILCASYGLPTCSCQMSKFMMGLEKTKARAGKILSSAQALSLQDMHCLYHQCFRPSATAAEMRQGITAYLFAWLLLLHIEEVIHVDFKSINIIPGEHEFEFIDCFDVHLKTQKSAQTGIAHAWTLHANDDNPKICPMWALIQLAVLYGKNITLSGPLFLKVNKNGAIMQDTPVTSSMLSRGLTTDLQDLGYKSWALYGTHSFRQGGCQHRIKNKGGSLDMVAAWGGWSQIEAITMFRYFYSPNDNHEPMVHYNCNGLNQQCVRQCSCSLSF